MKREKYRGERENEKKKEGKKRKREKKEMEERGINPLSSHCL